MRFQPSISHSQSVSLLSPYCMCARRLTHSFWAVALYSHWGPCLSDCIGPRSLYRAKQNYPSYHDVTRFQCTSRKPHCELVLYKQNWLDLIIRQQGQSSVIYLIIFLHFSSFYNCLLMFLVFMIRPLNIAQVFSGCFLKKNRKMFIVLCHFMFEACYMININILLYHEVIRCIMWQAMKMITRRVWSLPLTISAT